MLKWDLIEMGYEVDEEKITLAAATAAAAAAALPFRNLYI